MHEMGIILHLAKSLEETAAEQDIQKILRVTLQVGEVSGIMLDCGNREGCVRLCILPL